METLKKTIQQLTSDEFTEFYSWLTVDEVDRRRAMPHQVELITELRESGELPAPQAADVATIETIESIPEWVDPGTNHARMYTEGNVVRHNGKVWESIIDLLNSWEPGNDNGLTWRDITAQLQPNYDPNAPQPFKQPTGAHDAYPLGARVIYNGKVYRSLLAGNAYSPDTYPAGWEVEA